MKIYIDQSGKVENTAKVTAIAFSDGKKYAIKINQRTKRQIQEVCRRKGLSRLFIYRTFAALVFLLIKKSLSIIDQVVIDMEYPGHEKTIKEIILELLRKEGLKEPSICFARIGNRPKVHYAAYNVYAKKKKEDKLIKFEEIMSLVISPVRKSHIDIISNRIKKDRGRKRLKDA